MVEDDSEYRVYYTQEPDEGIATHTHSSSYVNVQQYFVWSQACSDRDVFQKETEESENAFSLYHRRSGSVRPDVLLLYPLPRRVGW